MRIILADHSLFALMGLKALLNDGGNAYDIVGEARTGGELLALVTATPCDLVITDFALSDGMRTADDLTLLTSLRLRHPTLPVIVLTTISHPLLIRDLLACDVHGVVCKSQVKTELLSAIESVVQGHDYQSARLRSEAVALATRRWNQLTPGEKEVAEFVSQGFTAKQIADRMQVHVMTITGQKRSAMRKLGLFDEQQLQHYLQAMGLLS